MRAMILAAGRGERMGRLTRETPKPLLRVADHYLIEYSIYNLKRAGVKEIIINVSYHAEQIKAALGDGKRYGLTIFYSEEAQRLEVGGGIFHASSWLGNAPFIVVSSDVITDFPFAKLRLSGPHLAHLVMVENPLYHLQGDFNLRDGCIQMDGEPKLTFGSIGLYDPRLFENCTPGYFSWLTWMQPAIKKGQVSGQFYQGIWYNIGTAHDLEKINQRAREDSNLRPLASETNTLSS